MLFLLFPDEKLKYAGLMESAMNIGTAIGPVIGSVLYDLVGYFYMFIIIGVSFSIYLPILLLLMPPDLNSDQEDAQSLIDNERSSNLETEQKISLFALLSDHLIQLSSFGNILTAFALAYFEPLLSFRIAEFTDSVFIQSLLFCGVATGSVLMALIIPWIGKCLSNINLLALGL